MLMKLWGAVKVITGCMAWTYAAYILQTYVHAKGW